ncbi:hypothetical protein [Anoxybacillus kestanbolensis]|uniref:hypothetical protein n=1 Tax=Anoxybacillus kestanbolensis TaxID=227476 RepID=UPI003D243698
MSPKTKACLIHFTGESLVRKTELDNVLEELKKFNGKYGIGEEIGEWIVVERLDKKFC